MSWRELKRIAKLITTQYVGIIDAMCLSSGDRIEVEVNKTRRFGRDDSRTCNRDGIM